MKKQFLLFAILMVHAAAAELSVPAFFGDHMVLQADKPVKIWGQSAPGAEVSAVYNDQTAQTRADEQGNWSLKLPVLQASAMGASLSISDGRKTLQFEDVLVGEVWFASGQSNINWPLKRFDPKQEAIRAADHPQIRFFQAAQVADVQPQNDASGQWIVCSPETAGEFSGVGYFYAKRLHAELGVPVGIIKSAWGGKPIEPFIRREALAGIPQGKASLEKYDEAVAKYDPDAARERYEQVMLKRYEERLARWQANQAEGAPAGKAPDKPAMPPEPGKDSSRPTTIWNGMIHPFVGFTIRGMIWYQGESNAGNHENAAKYGTLFERKIQDWREQWGDDFRYLWVQLANYKKPVTEPGTNDPWAVVQNHQRLALALPKTGMAVANDIGEADDIHPLNKFDVGDRLARWALADEYGKDLVKSGPLYRDHQIINDRVHIQFSHIGTGLKSRDGETLRHFEIQDEGGKWHWAQAEIKDDQIVVSHPEVNRPAAARYAWAANPATANLVNSEGLPASLFTTEAE
ncbi:MAG: sialate O-acetylesterase [Luteolibacter sp.]